MPSVGRRPGSVNHRMLTSHHLLKSPVPLPTPHSSYNGLLTPKDQHRFGIRLVTLFLLQFCWEGQKASFNPEAGQGEHKPRAGRCSRLSGMTKGWWALRVWEHVTWVFVGSHVLPRGCVEECSERLVGSILSGLKPLDFWTKPEIQTSSHGKCVSSMVFPDGTHPCNPHQIKK